MKHLMSLALLLLVGVGCSERTNNGSGTESNPPAAGGSGIGGGGIIDPGPPNDRNWGAMGYLDLIDVDAFADFAGYRVTELRNERIYVKLAPVRVGNETYYEGEVRLAYEREYRQNSLSSDAGRLVVEYKNPRFEALTYTQEELDKNPRHLNSSWQGVRFNKMYRKDGRSFLVAFFEEPGFFDWSAFGWNANAKAGAVMIMITDLDDSGFSGSVWYKNYGFTYAVKPTFTRCWEISLGPYNCQDFVVNGQINPALDNTPNVYRKLGEFYNLDYVEAGLEF